MQTYKTVVLSKNKLLQYLYFNLLAAIVLISIICLFWQLGVVVNQTSSLPNTLYLKSKSDLSTLRVGQVVLVCPENSMIFQIAKAHNILKRGVCPGNLGYLIKQIKSTAGDRVTINHDGVFVNDEFVINSKPLNLAFMPQNPYFANLNNYTLKSDEVLLMSDYNPYSFDARYFGISKIKQIESVLDIIF